MKIKVIYNYMEGYLPTKRCRKLRYREAKNSIDVTIVKINKKDAPIALITNESIFKNILKEEYRFYNQQLYIKSHYSKYYSGAKGLYPIKKFIDSFCKFNIYSTHETDESKKQEEIKQFASNYIIIDNILWEKAEEPRYVCMTFGLGHNHGGTSLMLENGYNPNISRECYFNALEREKAIKYTKNRALKRGDTDDIKRIGNYYNIEVIIPEAVKCKPQIEAGEGDKFINGIENIIDNSNSASEAGLLTMCITLNKRP